MTLEIDVTVRDIHAAFTVEDGSTTALLGPNGAGKSTILGAIAGTLAATGSVRLHRELIDVPPHRRRIGLLGQRALLFPHLSVLDNVAFGPRSHGVRRRAAHRSAQSWLERLDAAAWAERRPHQLSGGQQQRVALARALAAEPDLLLLDEPFSAIDAAAVDDLRELVRREVTTTCILVTHDLADALTLTENVVILEEGRIVEDGPTTDVLRRPRSRFAAQLAGVNLVPGTLDDARIIVGDASITGRPCEGAGQGVAVFAPRSVAVFPPEQLAGDGPLRARRGQWCAGDGTPRRARLDHCGSHARRRVGSGTRCGSAGLVHRQSPRGGPSSHVNVPHVNDSSPGINADVTWPP